MALRRAVPALLLGCAACGPVHAEGTASPLTYAEAALAKLVQNDPKAAVRSLRLALDGAPDDSTLRNLAGTVLLHTGDARRAQIAFEAAARDPNDAIARYGLGLALLAQGKRDAALGMWNRLSGEAVTGNDPALTLTRRYTQFLSGAVLALDEAGATEATLPGLKALAGMAAWRRKDNTVAIADLEAAQSSLPGDAVQQVTGLLLTFDPARPLDTTERPFAAAATLNAAAPTSGAVSGNLSIEPQEISDGVRYVSYSCDGQPLGLSNLRPFAYTWDTRQVANGWHTLAIATCDADGREITRTSRRLRIMNRTAPRANAAEVERWARIRLGLWQALTPRPDRSACAYALGALYRAEGKTDSARLAFARAAAARPTYGDVHAQLAVVGGIGTPAEAVWSGLRDEKVVALTFDDGPKPGVTEPLLDVLRAERVPATFFVIGRHVTEFPELTRRIANAGMELANHSYTHRNLTKISLEDVAAEMLQTQAAIANVTGKMPRYMRPPGGNWNAQVARIIREWGLTPCMWTVDAYSSEVLGAQQVANLVLRQVKPGAIILMHNGKLSTLQALPTIIRELRRRGYRFETVETIAQRVLASRAAGRQTVLTNNRPRRTE